MKHIKKVFSVILAFALMLPFFASFAVMADNSAIAKQNPLTQKSVLFVGDSICEGLCEWATMGGITNSGWSGRIIKNNNMTGLNLGKSGASMSNCRGSNTVINQLISQNGQDYDYIIIEGGGNDAWDSCAVGTIANGYDAEFDVNTFAGGLENTFQYAKKHFPNAILGFIFVYQQPMASYGKLADMSEYFTIAETICEKWGVPYLDLYFDEHFNKRVLKTDTKEFLPDYIHPNTAGYDVIAPRIDAWMKTLEQETYNLALNKKVTVSGINKGFYYEHEQWGVMAYDADINDGVASNTLDYNTGDWFGLYNGELTDLCTAPNNVGEIVIDLEKKSDISYVRAHLRNDIAAGTSAPSSITVSVSDDGSAYTQIGSLSVKSDDNTVYWADMDANASGRYIKLTATLQSMFCFLNEIEVYGSVAEAEDDNIAKFKGYKVIGGTGEGYKQDDSVQYQAPLTDGIYTEINNYTNDWFGFYNGEVTDARNTVDGIGTLVLNLEDVYKLSDIKIHLLNDFSANAKAPTSIKAYISSDNKNFSSIGNFTVDSTDKKVYWSTLNTDAEGQFIKFEFALNSAFCMLNEIKVYGDFVKEGIKYNDVESENYVNIAFNKSYTVSGSGDGFYWNDNGTITQYQAKLTDGINSDLKNFNNEWFAFYNGAVASTVNTVDGVGTIIIDLEAEYDMTQFRVHMWNTNDGGAAAPKSVKVSVSNDNQAFTEVGYIALNTNDKTIHWSKLEADATGRYVKMDFTLSTMFCMLNEIHVYGTLAGSDEDSSDVVDDSSDVVEDSSDVVEDSSDVIEDSSDVVEDSSDVVEDSSDVVEDSSDVVEDSSDVVEDSSDVVEDSSDVVDDSSDVVEDSSDVVDDSSDVVEDSSDVIEDSSDVVEDSSDDTSSEDTSSEDTSSEDTSSDDTSSDDESSDVIEEENEIGDINGNDKIDMTDYILLKRAYFGTYNFNETQNKAGDINQNGKIDMTDYILLKRIYFGTYTLKK